MQVLLAPQDRACTKNPPGLIGVFWALVFPRQVRIDNCLALGNSERWVDTQMSPRRKDLAPKDTFWIKLLGCICPNNPQKQQSSKNSLVFCPKLLLTLLVIAKP